MKLFRYAAAAPEPALLPQSRKLSFRFLASVPLVVAAASDIRPDIQSDIEIDDFNESSPPPSPPPELQLGGQALIEGVMMRSPRFVAAAVRRTDGSIQTRVEPFTSITKKHRWLGLPFLRGVVGLFEMMLLGTRYLNWSSNIALEDAPDETKPNSNESAVPQTPLEVAEDKIGVAATSGLMPLPLPEIAEEPKSGPAMPIWAFAGTACLSLMIGFGLFVALPNILTDWLLGARTQNRATLNISEGVIKLVIFVGYLYGVGRMPNIRRVFEYHGAEHKVVFAAENHRPLTPEGARPFDTPHPRCGTGFALLTVFVSVFCFAWLPWTESHLPRVLMRLALMPVIAGVSYEILKLTTNPRWKHVAILIMTPGLWLQRLTTRQPDDAQLEVSCEAMRTVIQAENAA